LSGHPFFPERNPNEKIRDWFHEHKIECIRDARYPSLGSVHQKFSTMRVKNEWHAFCGGIDLAVNRWDDNNHSMKGERWAEDFYKGGWHDVHSYVRGPACRDLEISFRERWNNPEWPRVLEGPPKKIENLALPSDLPLQDGTHVVQILRTYAPEYDDYDFAKNGELSAGAAWKRAIEKARYHIYIEDQYFVSYEIVNALRKRLDEVDDLTVIVLVPEKVNDLGDDSFHYYQNECIKKLTTAFGDRFAIYHLRNPLAPDKQIYVHAKLMIVDDVWVGIGSMNLNRRSMTHDSEIAIAIVDTDVVDNDEDAGPFPYCRFAHDLRLKLWAEHLRTVAGGPLSEAHSGFQEWRSLAGRENTPAVPHEAYEDRTRKLPWSWVDPNGSEEEIPPD
jgi:phosphatidylserine/phosphatidylglycerophosphate/cardiolipin synthase-like enzyme